MTAIEVKWRRGTRAENDAFTGAVGEVVYLTDEERIAAHDGVVAGGKLFPNVTDILNQSIIAADISGPDSTGEYSVTLDPVPSAYTKYMIIVGKVEGASVGDDALNVNSLGGKTIKKNGGADNLEADDLVADGIYVFIYDGTNLQLTGGATGAVDVLQYQEQQTSGTTGPSYTSGAFRTVPFNTEVQDTGSHGSVASDQITLAAGTYEFWGSVPVQRSAELGGRLRLYNITDTSVVVQGPQINQNPGGHLLSISGYFIIAGSKTFELQVEVNNTSDAVSQLTTGESEIYSDLFLRKVA